MIKKKSWGVVVLFLMTFILFVANSCRTSKEESAPIEETDVYVAGNTHNGMGILVPCYWKNGVRTDLSVIDASKDGYGWSIYISGSDVYVSGDTCISSNTNLDNSVPCYWKNGIRTDLGMIDASHGGGGGAIYVSGSDVYVAGYTYLAMPWIGDLVPCYWKNGVRTDLSVINASLNCGFGRSIYVSGSDIYVGGSTLAIEGKTDNSAVYVPCYWKNGMRTDLSMIDASKGGSGWSIYILGSDVYVGGDTKNSSNIYVPCYWKNGVRTDLSVIDASKDGYGWSIYISGSDIYVAGLSKNSSTVAVPCYWKNGVRTDLSVIDASKDGHGNSIYVSGNDIYVGGDTNNSSNVGVPCYWKNGVRTDLSVIDPSQGGSGRSIFVSNK